MKLVILLILMCFTTYSQQSNAKIYQEAFESGKAFSKNIKSGRIEPLKSRIPPKDTWDYSRLVEYKQNIGSKDVIYGNFLMPNKDKTIISYNLFAFDIKQNSYYFVAVVSYKVINEKLESNGSYLFTEKIGLKNWWMNVARFYQGNDIKEVPKKYLIEICPPPPFRE
ncbi:hypothetical protein [Tenacibaculum sp. 190524A05c]|uniref:hypothetical protein n=1 Tax=Tenacibaculum platacis TaxID=3137852 RepID=UPI0032B2BDDA